VQVSKYVFITVPDQNLRTLAVSESFFDPEIVFQLKTDLTVTLGFPSNFISLPIPLSPPTLESSREMSSHYFHLFFRPFRT